MSSYIIQYAGPSEDGWPVKDQGWRVYELTYARSYMGYPIKRKYQRPYRKLVGVFLTIFEATQFVNTFEVKP